jgi:hypothetical protein
MRRRNFLFGAPLYMHAHRVVSRRLAATAKRSRTAFLEFIEVRRFNIRKNLTRINMAFTGVWPSFATMWQITSWQIASSRSGRNCAATNRRRIDLALKMNAAQNHQRPACRRDNSHAVEALLDLGSTISIGLRWVERKRLRSLARAIPRHDKERMR